MGTETTSSKAEQWRGTIATTATASSLAKKTRNTLIAGSSRTCSDRRSGEDKCGNSMFQSEGRVYSIQLICHRCELRK